MKKVLKTLMFTAIVLPTVAFADVQKTTTVDKVIAATGVTEAQTEVKRENTTVISPRTGIRYTLGDTAGRPVVLKTAAVAAATPATASRIVAANPALSASSQEKAKQALISAAGGTAAQ
ncbi:hypothetical protein [Acinetobacter rudis]|uniref:Uncharacterized protein n=1 Tax=Acinetobacter rudis CIP 110305 TaxID=421052 RepID=S3PMX1_9GAMM|nr:hypothetical protein [Acinetobacter rudis]EPF80146.1 hypothetical protein F945_00598 [Acinetobacter rudis CIP 110305]